MTEDRDLNALVAGWRRAPIPELVIRCRALAMANQMGRLPTPVYDAWLQMSAVVTVCGGDGLWSPELVG